MLYLVNVVKVLWLGNGVNKMRLEGVMGEGNGERLWRCGKLGITYVERAGSGFCFGDIWSEVREGAWHFGTWE